MATDLVSFEYIILYYFACALLWVAGGSIVLELVRRYIVRRYPPRSTTAEINAHANQNYTVPKGGDPDEEHWFFCYSCADDRLAKPTDVVGSATCPNEKYHAHTCVMCGDMLHHENWLPKLVNFMDDYKYKDTEDIAALEINPDFPIQQFASFSERIGLLFSYGSAGFNVFAIVNKFIVTLHDGRDFNRRYDLTQYILAIAEFALVCAFALHFFWKSFRVTTFVRRKNPFTVWLGIFMTYLPQFGKANALWSIRFWDVDALVELFYHHAYLNYSGPEYWSAVVKFTFVLVRLPILIFFIFFPALGIFCRLLQVDSVIQQYISEWGYMDWITFLSFVNNFRFIADKLATVMQLGEHLYGSRVNYLFADILDVNPKYVFYIATLITTTGPSELYEMTKRSSKLWKHNIGSGSTKAARPASGLSSSAVPAGGQGNFSQPSPGVPMGPPKSFRPHVPSTTPASAGEGEPQHHFIDVPNGTIPDVLVPSSSTSAAVPATSELPGTLPSPPIDASSSSENPPALPSGTSAPSSSPLVEALLGNTPLPASVGDETVVAPGRAYLRAQRPSNAESASTPLGGRPNVPLRPMVNASDESPESFHHTHVQRVPNKSNGGFLAYDWIVGSFGRKSGTAARRKSTR